MVWAYGLLGLVVGSQMIAALFTVVDWERARWPAMLARAAWWWLLGLALFRFAPEAERLAFGWGAAAALVGFVVSFALLRYLAPRVFRRNNIR